MQEVETWIKENPDKLQAEYQKWFDDLDCPEPSSDLKIDISNEFPFD